MALMSGLFERALCFWHWIEAGVLDVSTQVLTGVSSCRDEGKLVLIDAMKLVYLCAELCFSSFGIVDLVIRDRERHSSRHKGLYRPIQYSPSTKHSTVRLSGGHIFI